MPIGVTNKQYYQDIADAIREKNGSQDTYTPSEMAQAVLDIETGGGLEPNYLYFVAVNDGTMKFIQNGTKTYELQYSFDKINWNNYTMGDNILIYEDEPIYWKGKMVAAQNINNYINMRATGTKVSAYGSCNSLFDGDGLSKSSPQSCFYQLFYNSGLIKPPELPSTIVENYSYSYMFSECTQMVEVPDLPALVVGTYSYERMFNNCFSITRCPELPAISLANFSYSYMFQGCRSIIDDVPEELPAAYAVQGCYEYMFSNCRGLTTAPSLPATTIGQGCYSYMFNNCKELVNIPVTLPATTLANACYEGMFKGCISIVNAPNLPSTVVKSSCYRYMFQNCTSLKTPPAELQATNMASNCYQYMFDGCSNLETTPEIYATNSISGCFQYMFRNCAKVNNIKIHYTGNFNSEFTYWVSSVSATGDFYYNGSDTTRGGSAIPTGWTVHTF